MRFFDLVIFEEYTVELLGRKQELSNLESLFAKKSASLVILTGRRRIGKSRLVAEFAKNYHFIRFSGIAPTKATTAQSERDHFTKQLNQQTQVPVITAHDWQTLFTLLAQNLPKGKKVILFDEISWMGSKDPDFLGLLKDAWDFHFSTHRDLIIVLCGSVSAWIEKEIVNSTAFLGRPSLYIRLQELRLDELNHLWQYTGFDHFSTYEKLKILAVTGGVPRYLELLNPRETADNNIKHLCFDPVSPLLEEYDRIFSDIFAERSPIYKKIINSILNHSQQQTEILNDLQRSKSGTVSDYLNDLIQAGFISRDFSWNLVTGKNNKLSQYRIKDNFIRFYLKFVEPNIDKIKAGLMRGQSLESLPGWYSTLGLQFENLVINNIQLVIKLLELPPSEVVNFGGYFQTKSTSKAGCQIDLLIQTKSHLLYSCEIKFSRQPISMDIIQQVQHKMKNLQKPKSMSCLPVLIHVNDVNDQVLESNFFYRVIDFDHLAD